MKVYEDIVEQLTYALTEKGIELKSKYPEKEKDIQCIISYLISELNEWQKINGVR